jgi:hypothetical protein
MLLGGLAVTEVSLASRLDIRIFGTYTDREVKKDNFKV